MYRKAPEDVNPLLETQPMTIGWLSDKIGRPVRR